MPTRMRITPSDGRITLTLATGITQERCPEQSIHKASARTEPEISFSVNFSILSDRCISGRAHYETTDHENEIIEIDAVRKALDNFMRHPILHVWHTERPIGTITKAEIRDKGLYIEASIFDTSDTDDVWHEIQSGRLNRFSIYGRRRKGNDQCRLSPDSRTSPCVTKGLDLWSISAVGENAVNPMTFMDVVKALRGDTVTEVEDTIEKADPEAQIVETPQQGDLLKADSNPSEILGRLSSIESTLSQLVESDRQVHDSMGDGGVEKCGCMEKAEEVQKAEVFTELEVLEAEEIVKAETIQKAVDEITKAFAIRFDALETRLKEMEEQTIQKGGIVHVIADQLSDEDARALNPLIANAKAMGSI